MFCLASIKDAWYLRTKNGGCGEQLRSLEHQLSMYVLSLMLSFSSFIQLSTNGHIIQMPYHDLLSFRGESIKISFLYFFLKKMYLCEYDSCMHGCSQRPEKGVDPRELELHIVMSYHVDAGN